MRADRHLGRQRPFGRPGIRRTESALSVDDCNSYCNIAVYCCNLLCYHLHVHSETRPRVGQTVLHRRRIWKMVIETNSVVYLTVLQLAFDSDTLEYRHQWRDRNTHNRKNFHTWSRPYPSLALCWSRTVVGTEPCQAVRNQPCPASVRLWNCTFYSHILVVSNTVEMLRFRCLWFKHNIVFVFRDATEISTMNWPLDFLVEENSCLSDLGCVIELAGLTLKTINDPWSVSIFFQAHFDLEQSYFSPSLCQTLSASFNHVFHALSPTTSLSGRTSTGNP